MDGKIRPETGEDGRERLQPYSSPSSWLTGFPGSASAQGWTEPLHSFSLSDIQVTANATRVGFHEGRLGAEASSLRGRPGKRCLRSGPIKGGRRSPMLLLARRLVETCGLRRRAILRGAKAHLQGQTRGFIPSWEGKATNQSSIAAELLPRNLNVCIFAATRFQKRP